MLLSYGPTRKNKSDRTEQKYINTKKQCINWGAPGKHEGVLCDLIWINRNVTLLLIYPYMYLYILSSNLNNS